MKTFVKVWLSISLIAIGFGIALLILAVGTGASWKDIPTFSLDESYEGVESLDIEIGYGKVEIIEGTTFSIFAENLLDDGLESYVMDGIWYIEQNNSNRIDVFGLKFPVRQLFHWDENDLPKIVITIPEDFVAKDFTLDIGAGSVTVEEISSDNGYFTVSAGNLEIEQIIIGNESQYNVGTGKMVLKDMNAQDITVDCGVGNLQIEGTITGDNKITCGIGKVDLTLTGDEDDYSFKVNSGIGAVVIDGDKYKSISNKVIKNKDADIFFDLDCGIGAITVNYQ